MSWQKRHRPPSEPEPAAHQSSPPWIPPRDWTWLKVCIFAAFWLGAAVWAVVSPER